MDILNQAMLFLLNQIYALVGSYGLAIILLTVAVRLVLWPLNTSQTQSMKKMQELQPKLKEIQDKHKDNPQKMQEAMMRFYAENKFNPFGGCVPLLIQLPIFIGLFGALNSPQFLAESAHEHFWFISRLYHTLNSHAGEPNDGKFSVQEKDQFQTAHTAELVFKTGKTKEQTIANPGKVMLVSPKPLIEGEPMTLTLSLKEMGLGDEYIDLVQSAKLLVINQSTKEIENVTFENNGKKLIAAVPTIKGVKVWHMDVLYLIIAYGGLMLLYQKVMSASQPKPAANADPQAQMQQSMMKMLPLMFIVMMFFIPIPAGVMIYLVVTTALMFIQTAYVNTLGDKKDSGKKTVERNHRHLAS